MMALHKRAYPYNILIILAVCCFECSLATAQKTNPENYPQRYFAPPLKIPLRLSGTFGELRTNHFHSGIDFRTLAKEGIPIYAAAAGYVSRIKIRLKGYGKALYITHPNGYTTVYAHLQKFSKPLEKYIYKLQYREKSFVVEDHPSKNKLKIKKGELIGYSGTTGGVAPHLHFEIRDTKTEEILNPLLFGFEVPDNIPPKILGVKLYTKSHYKSIALALRKVRKGVYKTNTAYVNGAIFLGLLTHDQQDQSPFKNGVYQIEVLRGGKSIYRHRLKKFAFENSKHLNLLIDFAHYTKQKQRYQKTYRHPKNKLQIYEHYLPEAFVIKENEYALFTVVILDFNGNKTVVKIPVSGVKNNPIPPIISETLPYKIYLNKRCTFQKNGANVSFPKGSVYENTAVKITAAPNRITVQNPEPFPLDKPFSVVFSNSHIPPKERAKYYIVRKERITITPLETKRLDTAYSTLTKTLGTYLLQKDTNAPVVLRTNFKNKQWVRLLRTLKIYAKDDLSGIKNYVATTNGEWLLMEYLPKKNLFLIDVNNLPPGKNTLKIIFADACGNETIWKKTVFVSKSPK